MAWSWADRPPLSTVWKEEIATDSYYGLSLDVIRREQPNMRVNLRGQAFHA